MESVLSTNKARDLKQIHNIKQALSDTPGNMADDLQRIISMQTNTQSSYIKVITSSNGNPPSTILYNSLQLKIIEAMFNSKVPIILGVDRTFNIGPVFATLIIFQIECFHNKRSRRPAVFLGPVYLHHDAIFEAYLHWTQCWV